MREARLVAGASPLPRHERPALAGAQDRQFCEHYRRYVGTLDLLMRQAHRAGEQCFLNYAGQTGPVVAAPSGELREAQVFVATLGASP